jgi:chemotaxis protein CheZ
MRETPRTQDLARRLDALRAVHPESDPEAIADVVRAVLATMTGDLTARETRLLSEVEGLGRTIANAKAEIAALRFDEITGSHIPSATDELDAIVEQTASATHAILEACETLDQVGSRLRGKSAAAMASATTSIYEACSFQDITGQRITKIVATLKAIEAKVANIVATFGGEGAHAALREPPADASPDGTLLSGPQLPTDAMAQAEIDRLLASFD